MNTSETITDMSTGDIAAMFNDQFSDMKSNVRERMAYLPRISLCQPLTKFKKEKGVELGDWFLTPAKVDKDDKPKVQNLGKSFECVVLHSSLQLSYRDEEDNRPLIESTEFTRFSGEPVFLLDSRNGPTYISAVAPYSGKAVHTIAKIKDMESMPHKMNKAGNEQVPAIQFDYNIYVLLNDGRIAIVNNTKRGFVGTDPRTGETCNFKEIAPDSFMRAQATCHKDTPGLTVAHVWKIGSVDVGGGSDEPRPSFEIVGLQSPNRLQEIRKAAEELRDYLHKRWADRISYAWSNTSPAQRTKLITAYVDVREILDRVSGGETVARMLMGKEQAPALLDEPEPDYEAIDEARKVDEQQGIKDLAAEVDRTAGLPDVIDVPASIPEINYGSDIKVEDLPF